MEDARVETFSNRAEYKENMMRPSRKPLATFVSTVTLALSVIVVSPAAAQWGGWGNGGYGYGYNNGYNYNNGYGYGYDNSGAAAGAAIGGLALGAIAGAAMSQENQYTQPRYAAQTRRGRLCNAWQPIYDDWGNFQQYRLVKATC
jgi:hypothetical protein